MVSYYKKWKLNSYYEKQKLNSLYGKIITAKIGKRYFTIVEDDIYIWKNLDIFAIKDLFGIDLYIVPLNEEFYFIRRKNEKEISYHKYKIIKQKRK